MLLKQSCAPFVALLGHLHPGRGVIRAEGSGEAKFPLPTPPALSLGHVAQIRMLCGDLRAYRQLV